MQKKDGHPSKQKQAQDGCLDGFASLIIVNKVNKKGEIES